MNRSLNIAVADDEPEMLDYYRLMLPRLGHHVVAAALNGRSLVEACRDQRPDLVILDIKMPEMDGIDAAAELYRDGPLPIILVSAFHDDSLIARVEADHVLAYLVKPIKLADLSPAIAVAMARFDQFQALQLEASSLKQALEERKLVERAKGIVMRRLGCDEPTAFSALQKQASSMNLKLPDLARAIIDSAK